MSKRIVHSIDPEEILLPYDISIVITGRFGTVQYLISYGENFPKIDTNENFVCYDLSNLLSSFGHTTLTQIADLDKILRTFSKSGSAGDSFIITNDASKISDEDRLKIVEMREANGKMLDNINYYREIEDVVKKENIPNFNIIVDHGQNNPRIPSYTGGVSINKKLSEDKNDVKIPLFMLKNRNQAISLTFNKIGSSVCTYVLNIPLIKQCDKRVFKIPEISKHDIYIKLLQTLKSHEKEILETYLCDIKDFDFTFKNALEIAIQDAYVSITQSKTRQYKITFK